MYTSQRTNEEGFTYDQLRLQERALATALSVLRQGQPSEQVISGLAKDALNLAARATWIMVSLGYKERKAPLAVTRAVLHLLGVRYFGWPSDTQPGLTLRI